MLKRIATTALVLIFLFAAAPVFAEEGAEAAEKTSGGVVGGLIGFIVNALSQPQDEPAEETALEAESVEPSFDLLTIRTSSTVFANLADDTEAIFGMDLFTYKF
jgi:hypothetical protein